MNAILQKNFIAVFATNKKKKIMLLNYISEMIPVMLQKNSYHFRSNPKCFSVSSTIDFQSSSGVRVAQATVDAKQVRNNNTSQTIVK